MTSFKYACIIHHIFEGVIKVAKMHDCVVNDPDIKVCRFIHHITRDVHLWLCDDPIVREFNSHHHIW